jgi:hypothetical protein
MKVRIQLSTISYYRFCIVDGDRTTVRIPDNIMADCHFSLLKVISHQSENNR